MEEMYSGYDSGRIVPDDVFFYVNPKNFSRKTIPSTPESVTREALPTGGTTGDLPFDDKKYLAPYKKCALDIEELANRCSTAQEFFENVFQKKSYQTTETSTFLRTKIIHLAQTMLYKSFYLNGMKDRMFVHPFGRSNNASERATKVLLQKYGIIKNSKLETLGLCYFENFMNKFCESNKDIRYTTAFFGFVYKLSVKQIRKIGCNDFIYADHAAKIYRSGDAKMIARYFLQNPISQIGYKKEDLVKQACGARDIVDRWIAINYPEGFDLTEREFMRAVRNFREYTKDVFEWDRVDAWKEHAKQLEKQIFKR